MGQEENTNRLLRYPIDLIQADHITAEVLWIRREKRRDSAVLGLSSLVQIRPIDTEQRASPSVLHLKRGIEYKTKSKFSFLLAFRQMIRWKSGLIIFVCIELLYRCILLYDDRFATEPVSFILSHCPCEYPRIQYHRGWRSVSITAQIYHWYQLCRQCRIIQYQLSLFKMIAAIDMFLFVLVLVNLVNWEDVERYANSIDSDRDQCVKSKHCHGLGFGVYEALGSNLELILAFRLYLTFNIVVLLLQSSVIIHLNSRIPDRRRLLSV